MIKASLDELGQRRTDFRFGSLADMRWPHAHVRFSPVSSTDRCNIF